MKEQFWSLPKARVLHDLQTNQIRGLDATQARRRLNQLGPNELKSTNRDHFFVLLLNQFKSPLTIILLLAAFFSFLYYNHHDGIIILVLVLVNSFIGFIQEYKAERTMTKLRQILAPQARVIREGQEKKIAARELVVGDIVRLSAGDRVPADCRVLQVQGLRINQATLTGESLPISKRDTVVGESSRMLERTNIVYASTLVVAGQAEVVVVATGEKTEIGQISREVSHVRNRAEKIEKEIASLGTLLLGIALVSAVIILVLGLYRGISLPVIAQLSVSILVGVVPESLPIVVTVILSIGLLRIYERGAIIRKMAAAETLGGVTTVCVDKTGTLTLGELVVEKITAGTEEMEVTGSGYSLSGDFRINNKKVDVHKHPALRLLLQLTSLATMSSISKKELQTDEANVFIDPTETALAVVAAKAGFYAFKEENDYPELLEVPFNDELRYAVSVHKFGKYNRTIVSGSPEKVLAPSKYFIQANGQVRPLLKETREDIESRMENAAANGYRLIAVAYIDHSPTEPIAQRLSGKVVFVGFLIMSDQLRDNVRKSVREVFNAGIRVMMVTGDHLLTAVAIGKKAGLLENDKQALHADELTHHNLKDISVVARALFT